MIFLLAANILALIALLLYILCIGLPYWIWLDPSSGASRIYYGLWELCVSINYDDYVCRSYGAASAHQDDFLVAVGGLEVAGMCLIFLALVCGTVIMCCMDYKLVLYTFCILLALFSAVCGIAGVILFGAKFSDGNSLDGTNLHASFYLALFAVVFELVAAIFYYIARKKIAWKYY